MRRAPIAVAAVVVAAAATVTTVVAQRQLGGEPPFVMANPWEPTTSYSAPSLCGILEDLQERTNIVLDVIQVSQLRTETEKEVAQANALGTATLLEWMRFEGWMNDVRAQEPDFACYHWGFSPPDE